MNQTIREVAIQMGFPDGQLRKWKHRKSVPHKYRLPMLAKAGAMGKTLLPEDFEFPAKAPKRQRKAA